MSEGTRKLGFVFAAVLALGACRKSGGDQGGVGGGGAPEKAKFTPEKLDEIRKIQIEGFECSAQEGMKSVAQVWCQSVEKNDRGVKVGMQVMAQACEMCQKMDLELRAPGRSRSSSSRAA